MVHHLCRGFWWTDYCLFPHSIPDRSLIIVGARDDLVPVKHVERMIRKETGAQILMHPHHAHAEFVTDLEWQEEIMHAAMVVSTQLLPRWTQMLECSGLPMKSQVCLCQGSPNM